jgi:predicted metal-dependent peptidase
MLDNTEIQRILKERRLLRAFSLFIGMQPKGVKYKLSQSAIKHNMSGQFFMFISDLLKRGAKI